MYLEACFFFFTFLTRWGEWNGVGGESYNLTCTLWKGQGRGLWTGRTCTIMKAEIGGHFYKSITYFQQTTRILGNCGQDSSQLSEEANSIDTLVSKLQNCEVIRFYCWNHSAGLCTVARQKVSLASCALGSETRDHLCRVSHRQMAADNSCSVSWFVNIRIFKNLGYSWGWN